MTCHKSVSTKTYSLVGFQVKHIVMTCHTSVSTKAYCYGPLHMMTLHLGWGDYGVFGKCSNSTTHQVQRAREFNLEPSSLRWSEQGGQMIQKAGYA